MCLAKITAAQNNRDPFAAESDRVSFDGGFLPLNTRTRPIRNFDFAVLHPERLLYNGIGPVLPLEPMRGLGSAHQMRSKLWIEMCRDLDTSRGRHRDRPQPPAYAANSHQIRHHIITGFRADGFIQLTRTVEILTKLHWRFELSR